MHRMDLVATVPAALPGTPPAAVWPTRGVTCSDARAGWTSRAPRVLIQQQLGNPPPPIAYILWGSSNSPNPLLCPAHDLFGNGDRLSVLLFGNRSRNAGVTSDQGIPG